MLTDQCLYVNITVYGPLYKTICRCI